VHAKLEIARPDGTTWVDVTDYLVSAEVELGSIEELGTGTGADIGVRTLTFELKNNGANIYFWLIADIVGDSEDAIGSDIDAIGGSQDDVLPWLSTLLGEPKWGRNSFAPRDKMSDWNNHGGTWSPLLWPYRPVSLSVAVTSPGVAPTQWARLFEGYLGDNIATDHHAVSVSCRDKSKRLMDAYIDVKKTYTGPISAEALIQAIINDYVTSPPTLYCPVASGITFDEMTVEYVSVWDAIKNVAAQMGWFIGYRWNGASFVLTLLEPPRNKTTADYHFDWEDDIYTETLDINDADIRNALTITYNDKTTQRRETLRYTDFAQLRNEESKDEYGGLYRVMQIEEADTSLIDTQVKALSFGEKCIWDLSELSATDKLNLPLLPELDLFSTFTVTNPLISSTTDFFAVQSIRHSLRFGENARFRTEVIATGRVVGAKSKWLDMETRPGRPGKPIDGDRIPPGELPPDRLPDYSLGVDKFMEGLKPPIMVTSKPDFPDPRYPIDTILFFTQDGRLYRVVGNDWVPMVVTDFSELNGKLQSNQIALGAIQEDLIAAGAITKTKIADGSIETPKLAAGAITADKIGANAVTANKINAGAITAEKIAAGAVTANKIEAGAVTADKITANEATINKIVAGIGQFGGISANQVAISATGDEGSIYLNAEGLTFKDANDDVTTSISVETGDAYFKGVVEAEAIILPVKPY
jgi:hypothetical protein